MSDASRRITSIILVTYNKLTYTKQCVESIRRHTQHGSYELIVVDNASTDGTVEWAENESDITLIQNHTNAGFPKGCNQGMAAASGEFLMLLNNDTIVTPGWLDGLLRCLLSDETIGAVSPVTNSASYWTTIPVTYQTIEEMELFASALHAIPDRTKWEERVKLVGYCMLMRREATERVGPLDECFGIGNFEDDDYGLRLRLAGYKLILCGDTFIHHYGSVSFSSEPEAYRKTFENNTNIFKVKWGFHPGEATHIRMDFSTVIRRESHGYKREGCAILEIGCGCGATILHMKQQFPGAAWFGVERNELAARVAEGSGITVFRSSEPDDWVLPDEGLSGIIIGDAHAYGTPQTMKRLVSLLAPGGWIAGCFANRFYYANIKQYLDPANVNAQRQAVMQYTMQQVNQLFVQSGFSYVKVTLAENKPEDEQAYIRMLEQLTDEAISNELTAAYLLVYGRLGHDDGQQETAEQEQAQSTATESSESEAGKQLEEPALVVSTAEDVDELETKTAVPEQKQEQSDEVAEQNDVAFTGERLVVNRTVKQDYSSVYNEHMSRYVFASRLVSGLRVLDAACGAGYGSEMLKRSGAAEVIGVDVDLASLELAKRDYGGTDISFVEGDVLALPFGDASFDVVVSFETIEHVASGADWIKESARVLKEGGLFIVSTPNRTVTNTPIYFEELPFNQHHRFEYRTAELIGELVQHYAVEAVYGQNVYDDSLFPTMRWLRELHGIAPDRAEAHKRTWNPHELIPLHEIKSAEPMYIVAVCRKSKRWPYDARHS
ncbi:methyltransferase domain-containing protein [Paenibacillus sinopodophylli]|uniref:methyltransferase domain-containing protein n=1 Tax=Paenibacillus sinopodophylli TaxID=1837342 RepID=UPI0014875997|nr:methyltransferase domain-containing protein [Paenibacillus sinopodophylli]